jgi:hypothetical protein
MNTWSGCSQGSLCSSDAAAGRIYAACGVSAWQTQEAERVRTRLSNRVLQGRVGAATATSVLAGLPWLPVKAEQSGCWHCSKHWGVTKASRYAALDASINKI